MVTRGSESRINCATARRAGLMVVGMVLMFQLEEEELAFGGMGRLDIVVRFA